MTGILSYGRIPAPHFVQADAGRTIDLPPGMRTMHTFKKLPMISPKTKVKIAISVAGATPSMCHIRSSLSSRGGGTVSDC